MTITIKNRGHLTAEENNSYLEMGFNYSVRGDFSLLDTVDPWSGMPNVAQNLHLFSDKEEAEAFAKTQRWIFNNDIIMTAERITKRETKEEREAREKQEKAEKEAKKLAKEKAKAEAVGLTVEEWKAKQKELAKARRYKTEIGKMKAEIKRMEREIKRKEKIIAEIEK